MSHDKERRQGGRKHDSIIEQPTVERSRSREGRAVVHIYTRKTWTDAWTGVFTQQGRLEVAGTWEFVWMARLVSGRNA